MKVENILNLFSNYRQWVFMESLAILSFSGIDDIWAFDKF